MHPYFRRLKCESPIFCRGPIGFRNQCDTLIKPEYLWIDRPCDHFRLTSSFANFIQLLLLADHSKIAGEGKVGILNPIEGCGVSNIVRVQTFHIELTDDLLISLMFSFHRAIRLNSGRRPAKCEGHQTYDEREPS